MIKDVYRYGFQPCVPLEEVEASLLLALMATESLHGEAQVRLEDELEEVEEDLVAEQDLEHEIEAWEAAEATAHTGDTGDEPEEDPRP